MERRKFLQEGCKACLFTGAGFLLAGLMACSPGIQILHLPVVDQTLRLLLSAIGKQKMQIVRPEG